MRAENENRERVVLKFIEFEISKYRWLEVYHFSEMLRRRYQRNIEYIMASSDEKLS